MRAKGMGADVIVTEVDPFKALEATMENFRVMPMDEAAKYGDIFVTATGCKDVIVERHFQVMKHNAILCNSGHFDCEVDVAALGRLAEERFPRRQNIEGFRLPDGRILNVLAESKLGSMPSTQLRAEVMKEMGCSEVTYNRAYSSLVKSGEVTKKNIRQRDGRSQWHSFLYCSRTNDKVPN